MNGTVNGTMNPALQDLINNPIVPRRTMHSPGGTMQVEVPQQVSVPSQIVQPAPAQVVSVDPIVSSPAGPQSAPSGEPPIDGQEPKKSTAEDLLEQLRVVDEPRSPDKKGPNESLSDFRRRVNDLTAQLATRDQELADLRSQVDRYNTGEIIPEIVKTKDETISELSRFRDLHALKLSPEYHHKFVRPLADLNQKAAAFARDNGIEVSILNQAYLAPNKREMQQILSNHLDPVSAFEARQLLDNIRDLNTQAVEAENEPQRTLAELQTAAIREREVEVTQSKERIANTAKDSWSGAIIDLRSTNLYPELTFRNDPEHDEKVVRPIITSASQEYGRLVTKLAEHGLRELPADIAKILAKYVALAQASAVMAHSRQQHHERAESLLAESSRISSLVRPPIGGRVDTTSAPGRTPQTGRTIEDRVDEHLSRVIGKV